MDLSNGPKSRKGLIAFWTIFITMFVTWIAVMGGIVYLVVLVCKALNKYLAS
jgi:hypothetical protein